MELPSSSSMNPARKVLDGVTYLSETVASVSYEPSRLLSSWVADQFAPKYWKSNAEIKVITNNTNKLKCKQTRIHQESILICF